MMGSIGSLFNRLRTSVPSIPQAPKPFTFTDQMHYEWEGAQAGLKGKKREDCPYDKEKEPGKWNHWVFGRDNAEGEMRTLANPTIEWHSTVYGAPPVLVMPTHEAVMSGQWKPQYAPIPPEWQTDKNTTICYSTAMPSAIAPSTDPDPYPLKLP